MNIIIVCLPVLLYMQTREEKEKIKHQDNGILPRITKDKIMSHDI